MRSSADQSRGAADPDWAAFSGLNHMKNHWDRAGWHPGRTAYYWYLTFPDEHVIHSLAAECQEVISGPHFDLVPTSELHMTLERVEFADDIPHSDLIAVQRLADESFDDFAPFDMTIGPLAGSAGAISFSASPWARIAELRQRLVTATRAAGYALDVPNSFRPHVGIAYCNQVVAAQPIVEQVASLRALPRATVHVHDVALVELTRNQRSYSWNVIHRVPLTAGD